MRSAYRRLDGVSRVRLKRNTFTRVQLGGQRRVYHHLLSVCRLLHRNSMVDEKTGHTAFRDFRRDEAIMWRLFEDFVTGFYEREQHIYRVNPGGRRRIDWADTDATDAANRARIPVMEADVILESPERRQLLAYLRNRQATRPAGARHEGILLYPQVGDEPQRAEVWLEGFRIQARTVDLGRDWRRIRGEMLGVIGG